jgi:fatty acid desaturase
MRSKQMKPDFKDMLADIAVQLFFLIAGTILVGIGTNFYFAIGLALLLIYTKTIK